MEAKAVFLTSNNILLNQLSRICSDLSDEQVRYAHEAVDERGLSNVVVHSYWSVVNRSRALLGLEREAPPGPPQRVEELVAFLNSAHVRVADAIEQITEEQFTAVVKLPYAELPGATALAEGFAHAFRHVGNVLDARHLGGFETHALG